VIYKYDLETGKYEQDKTLVDYLAKKYTPPAVTHTKITPITTGAKDTATKGGTTSYSYPDGRKLMLCGVEKMEKGNTYRVEFIDDDNNSVIAITPTDPTDKIGAYAWAREIGVLRDNFKKEVTLFARFRDLEWVEPKKKEVEKKKEDQPEKLVRFRNGVVKTAEETRSIIERQDCGLCSGFVREVEAADTILMSNGGIICPDCIKQGRHFAFGFGQ